MPILAASKNNLLLPGPAPRDLRAYAANQGLIAYFGFDQATALTTTTQLDLSGYGNAMTLVGGGTLTDAVVGEGLSFPTTNSTVWAHSALPYSVTYPFSMSAFVDCEALVVGNAEMVCFSGTGQSTDFVVMFISGSGANQRLTFNVTQGSASRQYLFQISSGVGVGKRHFVATATSSTVFAIYFDGALITSPTITTGGTGTPSPANLNELDIGAFRSNGGAAGQFFTQGYIDEVKIWNRALDQGDVSELYQAGVNKSNYSARSVPQSLEFMTMQPSTTVSTTARVAAMGRARSTFTGFVSPSARMAGAEKVRGTVSPSAFVNARTKAQAQSRGAPTGSVHVAAVAKAQAEVRAVRTGTAALTAKAKGQAEAQSSVTATAHIEARATAMGKAQAQYGIVLRAVIAAAAKAMAPVSAAAILAGRIAGMLKAFPVPTTPFLPFQGGRFTFVAKSFSAMRPAGLITSRVAGAAKSGSTISRRASMQARARLRSTARAPLSAPAIMRWRGAGMAKAAPSPPSGLARIAARLTAMGKGKEMRAFAAVAVRAVVAGMAKARATVPSGTAFALAKIAAMAKARAAAPAGATSIAARVAAMGKAAGRLIAGVEFFAAFIGGMAKVRSTSSGTLSSLSSTTTASAKARFGASTLVNLRGVLMAAAKARAIPGGAAMLQGRVQTAAKARAALSASLALLLGRIAGMAKILDGAHGAASLSASAAGMAKAASTAAAAVFVSATIEGMAKAKDALTVTTALFGRMAGAAKAKVSPGPLFTFLRLRAAGMTKLRIGAVSPSVRLALRAAGMLKAKASAPAGRAFMAIRATAMGKGSQFLILPIVHLRIIVAGMAKAVSAAPNGITQLAARAAAMAKAIGSFATASGLLPFTRMAGMAKARILPGGTVRLTGRAKGAAQARGRLTGAFFLAARMAGAMKEMATVRPLARLAGHVAGAAKARVAQATRAVFLRGLVAGAVKVRSATTGRLSSLSSAAKGMGAFRVQLQRGLLARISGMAKLRDAFLTSAPFSRSRIFRGRAAPPAIIEGRDGCTKCCEED